VILPCPIFLRFPGNAMGGIFYFEPGVIKGTINISPNCMSHTGQHYCVLTAKKPCIFETITANDTAIDKPRFDDKIIKIWNKACINYTSQKTVL